MVEPPTILGAAVLAPFFLAACASNLAWVLAFFCHAFSIASHQMPLCDVKALSSDASTARLSVLAI